jgi:hypothetical protein
MVGLGNIVATPDELTASRTLVADTQRESQQEEAFISGSQHSIELVPDSQPLEDEMACSSLPPFRQAWAPQVLPHYSNFRECHATEMLDAPQTRNYFRKRDQPVHVTVAGSKSKHGKQADVAGMAKSVPG